MRILYLHTTPIEIAKANVIQVLHMCQAFAELGHSVHLTVPQSRNSLGEPSLAARHLGKNAVDFTISTHRRLQVPWGFKSLGSAIAALFGRTEAAYDLLFVRNEWVALSALKSGRNVIFESHSPVTHTRSLLLNRFLSKKLVAAAHNPSLRIFLTISEELRSFWVERGVPVGKLLALHDGFDAAMFEHLLSKEEARNILGLPKNQGIVTYTGRVHEDRGTPRLLSLARAFPQLLFTVVGGPNNCVGRFRKIAASEGLKNVVFTGPVLHAQIPLHLAAADVLLMLWSSKVPTIYHCSPLKLVEYMASGRIIIGDGFPTIREVVKDGVHAFLAEPEDLEGLKRALRKAISECPAAPIAMAARERAFCNFTWKHRCQRIIKFYQSGLQ